MSGKRILLVEDDPDVRESCAELLRDFGHTVVAVDDGAVALSEIPRLRPDVSSTGLHYCPAWRRAPVFPSSSCPRSPTA
jgi:CheY-like chemotaxis protein